MSVLIFGFPSDVHLHAVRWALSRISVTSEALYTSDLPATLRSSIRFAAPHEPRAEFRAAEARGASGEFDTVWFRRSGVPMRPAAMTDADWTITERECNHHIRSLRHHLAPDAFWVNNIEARERALLKPLQLAAARDSGFTIPETLISNDPDEIRSFFGEFRDRGVVFKLSYQANWQARDESERFTLFTTELAAGDLRDDAALSSCPAIYQEKVAKRYELRVTCLDEVCFAARLDSQSSRQTRVDWRNDFCDPLTPHPVELPRHVEEQCLRLMKRLGLVFGCIDLIVTPDGRYVFLEVNEMGQFLWLEARTPAFPLLRAFATLLVDKRLRKGSPLVGSDAVSFEAFRQSGAWERSRRHDGLAHAAYVAPGVGIES